MRADVSEVEPGVSADPRPTATLQSAFPLSLPRHPLLRWIKLAAGEGLARWLPERTRRLLSTDDYERYTQVDRFILAALGQRALLGNRYEELQRIHHKFWKTGIGAALMAQQDWRLEHLFLAHHQGFVAPFASAIERAGCRQLLEIGCGTGDILQYLLQQLPSLDQACGIDLNAQLIAHCQSRWQDPRLSFVCGDGIATLKALGSPPMALLSYGGVLEYFLEDDLLGLFTWLAHQARPCVVGCVEPVDDRLQSGAGAPSRPYGAELSFSHDYEHLLRKAGFTIRFVEDAVAGTQRFVMVVAEAL